ncbi:MAG TPA: hypothetical protein VHL59_10575, partial [Thermoanaerobaculia bacterium]|nr:hypothetical protein [Thermoanaerobaculia bacterium]
QLVFYSDRSSREEVWTLDLASREMRRLSRNGGIQPSWSRDGRRVAWGIAAGLQVYDLSAERTVTIGPGLMTAYPAYSPDGRNICFQGWSQNSGYRLYLAPAGGGAAREVPTPEGSPGNPSFSPDGRTIYYQLDDKLSQRNVWALDVVSGASRQITRGNTDDAHPDVSPDGRSLLFLRNHSELHVMPIEGGPSRIVLKYEGYNRLVEFPAWSPDGKSIVFSLAEKSGDIFRMQLGGAKSGK